MVQYVFTPWRDRQELLLVRQQFYASSQTATPSTSTTTAAVTATATTNTTTTGTTAASALAANRLTRKAPQNRPPSTSHPVGGRRDDAVAEACGREETDQRGQRTKGAALLQQLQQQRRRRQDDQHLAVARVSMWMQRGHCPHMVESTALLMAAILSDEEAAHSENAASSTYAIRASYSAAFSRFVTGLLDSHQDKQRKQSMFSIAKTIGLPATFVELRHQSTHEQLPSRAKLRSAAVKALDWIWDYYWKHLGEEADRAVTVPAVPAASSGGGRPDPCAEAVLRYLREDDEARQQKVLQDLRRWERSRLMKTVAEVRDTLPGNQAYLRCMSLSQQLASHVDDDACQSDAITAANVASEKAEAASVSQEHRRRASAADGSPERVGSGDGDRALDTGWSRYPGTWKPKPIGIV